MATGHIDFLVTATDQGLEAVAAKVEAIAAANERINAAAQQAKEVYGTGIEGVGAFQNLSGIEDATEAFQRFYQVIGNGDAQAGTAVGGFARTIGEELNADTIGQFNEQLGRYQFAVQNAGEAEEVAAEKTQHFRGALFDLGNVLQTTLAYGLVGTLVFKVIEIATQLAALDPQLEKIKTQLAGTFQQYTPGIQRFGQALQVSGDAMDYIRQKAAEHGVSETQLATQVQQTTASLLNAGLSIRQNIDLNTQLKAAQQVLGLSDREMVSDLDQIFNGHVRVTNVLAQKLDITGKERASDARKRRAIFLRHGRLAKLC